MKAVRDGMGRPENLAQAKKLQESLATKVRICRLRKKPELVAGVDASFSQTKIFAAAALYKLPELILLEETGAEAALTFPYIPGYLSFREGAAVIRAIQKLSQKPDVILFDGQGIAHPKGLGIASHIGVLLNIPAIGCAKSRLIGEFKEPRNKKGCRSPLLHKGRIIGSVLRTRDNVRPLFVSPGHRIDLEDSIQIVLACTPAFRIPEPLRHADALSRKLKKAS
ncbi:MAG: deoxyribonuclease V [Candidatus Aminicenantales bacterium]